MLLPAGSVPAAARWAVYSVGHGAKSLWGWKQGSFCTLHVHLQADEGQDAKRQKVGVQV